MSRKTERRKKKNCKGNKLSMDKVLMREAQDFLKIYKHDKTRNSYETNYKKYIDFLKKIIYDVYINKIRLINKI